MSKLSDAEEVLSFQMRANNIEHQREYPFAKPAGRRFRSDFRVGKLLIEVEGGVWTGGRHNRPAGFSRDMEKYNLATELGFSVLRYTPEQVNSGEAIQQVKRVLAGKAAA